MKGQQVVAVMEHARLVEQDIALVDAELEAELQGVVEFTTSVYGVAVEDTPHMAVLRDQRAMLVEELDACHLCMNV